MEHSFVLLAGDARLRALLHLLEEKGISALHLTACRSPAALEAAVAIAKTLVLPVPMSRDGVHLCSSGEECILLEDVLGALRPGQEVFGGAISADQKAKIEARGAKAVDFLRDAPFVLKNAAFTAQGALRLLLEHLNVPLQGLPVLVTGYGRVGKAAGTLLRSVGCRVSVAARSEVQRTEAALSGCAAITLDAMPAILPRTAAILNTAPAPLFDAGTLRRCQKDALYLELASAPFGAQETEVRAAGLHYVFGGGLPGRFCAAGCADAMLQVMKGKCPLLSPMCET